MSESTSAQKENLTISGESTVDHFTLEETIKLNAEIANQQIPYQDMVKGDTKDNLVTICSNQDLNEEVHIAIKDFGNLLKDLIQDIRSNEEKKLICSEEPKSTQTSANELKECLVKVGVDKKGELSAMEVIQLHTPQKHQKQIENLRAELSNVVKVIDLVSEELMVTIEKLKAIGAETAEDEVKISKLKSITDTIMEAIKTDFHQDLFEWDKFKQRLATACLEPVKRHLIDGGQLTTIIEKTIHDIKESDPRIEHPVIILDNMEVERQLNKLQKKGPSNIIMTRSKAKSPSTIELDSPRSIRSTISTSSEAANSVFLSQSSQDFDEDITLEEIPKSNKKKRSKPKIVYSSDEESEIDAPGYSPLLRFFHNLRK